MSEPQQFFDGLLQFDLGMNSGVAPSLLPKNQLAFAANATVRGTFVKPRPPVFNYTLDFQGNSDAQSAVLNGFWQGGCYGNPGSSGIGTVVPIGTLTTDLTEPVVGGSVVINITLTVPLASLPVGTEIRFGNNSKYIITAISGTYPNISFTATHTAFGSTHFTFPVGSTVFTTTSLNPTGFTPEILVASISGRLFTFSPNPSTHTAIVREVTGGNNQNPTAPQCWLWQSEKWIIWNDGLSLPVFYDLETNTTQRSAGNSSGGGGGVITNQPPVAVVFITTAPPGTSTSATLSGPYIGAIGDTVNFNAGTINYVQGVVTGIAGNTVTFSSQVVSGSFTTPVGSPVYSTSAATPAGTQLPPGKMGAYGKGRNWMCLTDGITFIASDIVGGSSGTAANDFRDAVLNITENNYLVGGGTFRVPLSGGQIRAMIFQTESDASLGQGPLQIFTPNLVFSCVAPVDRLTWQSLTNPILTVSLIGAGALGQNSVTNANGDILFRSLLGVSSYILGRRDFDVWGNVPISREVSIVLDRDAENLLPYGSCVIFDNRLLMSCAPTVSALGVYHAGLVAINFDALSTMQGKKPSCWDGLWPGFNAFQFMVGEFSLVNRCYAFCLDLAAKNIVLREVLSGKTTEIYDNATSPIQWTVESPVLFREQDPSKRQFKKLDNGEIWVDELQGTVHFLVQYKPDDYPCWIDWLEWDVCADMTPTDAKAAFNPRMGLGSPSANDCDSYTNRPFRLGYYFQVRIVVTGQCRFKGAKFTATAVPEPKYSPPICKPLC